MEKQTKIFIGIIGFAIILFLVIMVENKGISQEENDRVNAESANYVKEVAQDEIEDVSKNEKNNNMEKIDSFVFDYDENNRVTCTIANDIDSDEKSFFCIINCEDSKAGFAKLIQTVTWAETTDKYSDYIINYEISGESYYTICKDGELMASTSIEINVDMIDERQIEKQLEYSDELKRFFDKNK